MRNRKHLMALGALFVLLGLPLFAFAPIATVTSAEPFLLDGRAVAVSDIISVPLTVGHEVWTADAPAVLYFFDGSSVKLAPSSRVRLMGSETEPKLVLLAGALDYKVVLGSNLSVTSLDLERRPKAIGRATQIMPRSVLSQRKDATLSVVTH